MQSRLARFLIVSLALLGNAVSSSQGAEGERTNAPAARPGDWPQYRGPQRDDVSRETGLLQTWPAGGPPLAWKYDQAGVGYSGLAVVGDRLYTIGARDEHEYLIALDLPAPSRSSTAAGETPQNAVDNAVPREAWAVRVGPKFEFRSNRWSAGPSSTPTVDGELIYALGGNGDLVCVQAVDGQERWRVNFPDELQAQINPIGGGPRNLGWGFTWSPLVDGERLICLPGGPQGTVAALDKHTGKVLWRSGEVVDQAAYTSPMLADIGGVRQYVALVNQGLFAVAADDGRLLWRHPRRYGTEVVNTPLIRGDRIYTTVGAGGGSDLVRIVREANDGPFLVESIYSNKNLSNHHGNVILVGDHVYGASQGRGWVCLDFATGEIAWSERRGFGAGALAYADNRLYCYAENDGALALIAASPDGWQTHGRFAASQSSERRQPQGKVWTPPIIAGGRLFVRDQELLFCYDIRDQAGNTDD